ncbi:hypothetical protein [Actinacidiphila guanduensis]|uniref:hypothetical protein n=1 Tax=Actinacidiphila guanduensis TaxID=310781 RepID=UPI0015A11D39|nr:hypothetical protein [Actinacidiphila guanduensis]
MPATGPGEVTTSGRALAGTFRTRPTGSRAPLAVSLLCLAVFAAGCGGSAAGSSADGGGAGGARARAVTDAADALVRAGSSRVTTAMRMASGGTWVTVTGTGGFDYARHRGRLTLLLPRDALGKEEHRPVTELFTPGALYMKNRGAGVPAAKWVRVDTTRLADGNLVTGGATEPQAAAELLRGATDVRYVGAGESGGVQVRHFRGTIDLARAAGAASAADKAPLTAAAKGFTVTRVPFDAWLDAQGRLRRLTERFTYGPGAQAPAATPAGRTSRGTGAAGKGGAATKGARPSSHMSPSSLSTSSPATPAPDVTIVSTTTYSAFGTPVHMTLPDSSDIWTGKIVSAQP